MVCIQNGLFSSVKGRLRGLVFFTRAGRAYVRSRPEKVRNPRTPLQQQQRDRMRDVVGFYNVMKQSVLIRVWRQEARRRGMLGINLFVKLNIGAFDGTGHVTDYRKLHFTCGTLPQGDCFRVVYQAAARTVDVRWENRALLNERHRADRFTAVVLFEDDGFMVCGGDGHKREDCQARICLPEECPRPVRVYCFFVASGGKDCSADVCCLPEDGSASVKNNLVLPDLAE